MDIANLTFKDGFGWVLTAAKRCLPNALSFVALAFLATLLFNIGIAVIGFIAMLLAVIPILGWFMDLALAILIFVLSLGFSCGFIKAVQEMLDRNSVSFGSFFFGVTDLGFLIKLVPFAIILGLIYTVSAGVAGWFAIASVRAGDAFLGYLAEFIALMITVALAIYTAYAMILFIQRDKPKVIATLTEAGVGIAKNLLPILGMYTGMAAVSVVILILVQIVALIAGAAGSGAASLAALLTMLALFCGAGFIFTAAICQSAKDIFTENPAAMDAKDAERIPELEEPRS